MSLAILLTAGACESILDVDLDESKIVKDRVFSDDETATAAVTGIYVGMLDAAHFASGSNTSVTALAGLMADELDTYTPDVNIIEFRQNALLPKNNFVLSLWASMYQSIYQANGVLEGLAASTNIKEATNVQLDGEVRFVRAFCYFYLLNFYGEVPLITTTDYRITSVTGRSTEDAIYQLIIDDLDLAETKLGDEYITGERVRPNRATAIALKARINLFLGRWADAEAEASKILGDSKYTLTGLNDVFKANSPEAIWQLRPVSQTINTQEGYNFILTNVPANDYKAYNALSADLLASFESNDQRRDNWVSSFTSEVGTWYYPYKYKVQGGNGGPLEEYSVVFRLAEQYLIRAEARAKQGNVTDAIGDVDAIRGRAGLPLVADTEGDISADDLLAVIAHERRIELFTEWGHRWLDLKRTGQANTVLPTLKPAWNPDDRILPLPQIERNRNPRLGNQNPGYF
jgi:hypothetical protein